MDSGYIAPGEDQVEALEVNYDTRRELTPEEVVGLMDQLLCHEVSQPKLGVHHRSKHAYADAITDGLAYGPSTLTNALYLHLYRQATMADAEDIGGSSI